MFRFPLGTWLLNSRPPLDLVWNFNKIHPWSFRWIYLEAQEELEDIVSIGIIIVIRGSSPRCARLEVRRTPLALHIGEEWIIQKTNKIFSNVKIFFRLFSRRYALNCNFPTKYYIRTLLEKIWSDSSQYRWWSIRWKLWREGKFPEKIRSGHRWRQWFEPRNSELCHHNSVTRGSQSFIFYSFRVLGSTARL